MPRAASMPPILLKWSWTPVSQARNSTPALEKWVGAGYPVTHIREVTPGEFINVRGEEPMFLVDVRTRDEFGTGHVPGARNILAGHLADRVAELPRDGTPIAVICGTGYRSTVAASVLERAGFPQVVNITGGMAAWLQSGLPTE